MKLSDIRGEQVFDVVADLIEPITEIASDPKVAELFKGTKVDEKESNKAFAIRNLKAKLPYLLKTYKIQLMAIFAILNGKSYEDYRKEANLFTLGKEVLEVLNDEALTELFTSAVSTKEPTPPTEDSTKQAE